MLFFFLLLTDYIYMWGLVDAKYKKWNYLPLAVAVVCTALVFFWSVYQSNYDLKNGFFIFAASREFYLVPFFGWAKWAIDGYLHSQYLFTLGGTGLLLACCLIIVVFFLRFNKDITEQAVADAEEASAFLRRAKENGGRARIEDGKVKRGERRICTRSESHSFQKHADHAKNRQFSEKAGRSSYCDVFRDQSDRSSR